MVYYIGAYFPSVLVIVLSDALPPKVRKFSAVYGMTVGVIFKVAFVAALYFNWCGVEPIVFKVGFITVSMASLATNGLINTTLVFPTMHRQCRPMGELVCDHQESHGSDTHHQGADRRVHGVIRVGQCKGGVHQGQESQ